jgi:hypothetical protein
MFGDFSRDSFDPGKHYTRVLMQQGRPLTDADWNEQVSTLWQHLRALTSAIIGWHGTGDRGFAMLGDKLQCGRYYVDGILIENERTPPVAIPPAPTGTIYYLDVWEDSLNAIAAPDILEPALRGIDTSVRVTTRWALRTLRAVSGTTIDPKNRTDFTNAVTGRKVFPKLTILPGNRRDTRSAACEDNGAKTSQSDCIYRIEIHRAGIPGTSESLGSQIDAVENPVATFKWSRANGATTAEVIAPAQGNILKLGRTRMGSFEAEATGSWLELMDFEGRSVNEATRLLKVKSIDSNQVLLMDSAKPTLAKDTVLASYSTDSSSGYFVRKWDHAGTRLEDREAVKTHQVNGRPDYRIQASDGALAVVTGARIELENGIAIQFDTSEKLLAGDYWLIRATSTGALSILPGNKCESAFARCEHHFAPLFLSNGQSLSEAYRAEFPEVGDWPPKNRIPSNLYRCDLTSPTPASPEPADAAVPSNGPAPERCEVSPSPPLQLVSLLSKEGNKALQKYAGSLKELTRRVPARYLNHEPQTAAYSRFRSALLVSEILEDSFESYFKKVQRCLPLEGSEKALVEADARADYALAVEFERMLLSDETSRPRIA